MDAETTLRNRLPWTSNISLVYWKNLFCKALMLFSPPTSRTVITNPYRGLNVLLTDPMVYTLTLTVGYLCSSQI